MSQECGTGREEEQDRSYADEDNYRSDLRCPTGVRCAYPGCDRPHTWCDAHHVVHWADGGPTALPNLLLLCRRHHRMVHQRDGFRLELLDGRPVFRRPDGSMLEERAPP